MNHETNTDNPVDFPKSTSQLEAFEKWRDKQLNKRYGTTVWEAWQAACEYQRERDAGICERFGNDGYGYLPAAAIRANKGG